MMEKHEALFSEFAKIHDRYEKDQFKWQKDFNRSGREIMDLVREYEKKLCGKTERGKNAVFSGRLAERFREEVKAYFPLIDFIGVVVSKKSKIKNQKDKLFEKGKIVKVNGEELVAEADKDVLELEKICVLDDDSGFKIKRLL